MAEFREKHSAAALDVAKTAVNEMRDACDSWLLLRYWRLRFAALEPALKCIGELRGEVDSLKMKVVALKRLYQSKP